MARTDAVQFFLELAAEWRRLGAEVTFEPGWERRGNGTSAAYEGGVVHHTASSSSFSNPFPTRNLLIVGRSDLSGPLCNVAGPVCPDDRPRLHIIAAHPANHAGASGGRSMGPLPRTSLFNKLVVGLEIDYAGLTPMFGGQYKAALIFTRGLANVLDRSVEYIRAHAETSVTGKWDPGYANGRTIDMAVFRRDALNLTSEGSSIVLDDATATQISKIVVNALTTDLIQVSPKVKTSILNQMAYDANGLKLILDTAAATQAEVTALRALLKELASDQGLDGDALQAFISAEVDRALVTFRERVSEGYELRLEPKADG